MNRSCTLFATVTLLQVPAAAQSPTYLDEDLVLHAFDAAAGDLFGGAVDMDGDTLVVGATGNDGGALDAGAAYVFERVGGVWDQTAKLLASDPMEGDSFGKSVSIHGDILVVGAHHKDVGNHTWAGAAYVFARVGGAWVQEAKLEPSDPGDNHLFGFAVSSWGDKVLVGTPNDDIQGGKSGSAYLYVRAGSSWNELERLVPADSEPGLRFGFSLAIDGPRLVVGAPHNGSAIESFPGAAYVYVRTQDAWIEEARLEQAFGDPGIGFGYGVDLDQRSVAVGAPFHYNGMGFVFRRGADDSWHYDAPTNPQTLGQCCARFGSSIRIEGDVVVGGGFNEWPSGSGMAYVHERHSNWWGQKAYLRASDREYNDEMGWSVALSGNTMATGAWKTDDLGEDSGSVYVHSWKPLAYATVFCEGDGSAGPCPCGNETLPANRSGCGNSVSGNGAALYAVADDFLWCYSDAMTSALLFVGANDLGAGVPFGGGLKCLGGGFQRIGTEVGSGLHSWGWGDTPPFAGMPGDTILFQVWYRVPAALNPCGAQFNLSNALAVTLQP